MSKKENIEKIHKNDKDKRNSDINHDITNMYKKIGNNKFICNNKIILGNKYYNMIISFTLITIPTILFIITMFFIYNHSSIILAIVCFILYILIIICLLMGGCSDPGLVERNNEYAFYDNRKSVIKMNIKGHMVKLNYCYTCFHFRPPRTSHCAECDNCVENFDHHCLWMGTCVGKRNYKYFYCLISLTSILCLIILISSIIYLIQFFKNYFKDEDKRKHYLLIIIFLCIDGFIALLFLAFFLVKLLFLHTYLIWVGLNFYEYLKHNYFVTLDIKPYSRGCLKNIINKLFKKIPLSKLNYAEINKKDDDIFKTFNENNIKIEENDRNRHFTEENNNNSNINNNAPNSRNIDININNNDLTATFEKQSSTKEKILSNNSNINENINNSIINGNSNIENNASSKSNEIEFKNSINCSFKLSNREQNIFDLNKTLKIRDNRGKYGQSYEIKNINEYNISKTKEDIKVKSYIQTKNKNYFLRPRVNMKQNKEEKHFSNDSIPSKEIILDYYNKNEVKIVKNELAEIIGNNPSLKKSNSQGENISKTHYE